MNIPEILEPFFDSISRVLPSVLGALAILVVGWIAALILRAATRKGLGWLKLDERTASGTGRQLAVEAGIATIVFYVVLLVALLGALNALSLELVSEPLQALLSDVLEFLPRLVGAIALAIVAWIIASVARSVTTRAVAATSFDERFGLGAESAAPSQNLGNVCYGVILLMFLPAVLGTLEMPGLLAPVQDLVTDLVGVLPNLLAAVVIGFVGWFVARLLRDLVSNMLSAAGADRIGGRLRVNGSVDVPRVAGLTVYVLTLVPALIAALNALGIEAIADPASHMLEVVLAAVPQILAAALILGITWFVARLVGEFVSTLLETAGANRLPQALGLTPDAREEVPVARFAGRLVVVFAMLFAAVEAAGRLGFGSVAELLNTFIAFSGQVLLGCAIISLGFALAGGARRAILRSSGGRAAGAANLTRFAVLGMVSAMGLRAMGVADAIVNLAFGLTLGAIAVAVAIAFGIGGREAAGQLAMSWVRKTKAAETEG